MRISDWSSDVCSSDLPIIEEGLSDLLRRGVEAGQLRATTDPLDAILNSDVSMVCVGTPSRENGSLNVDTVVQVCLQIGECLRQKDDFHAVVIRSTILPGTMREIIQQTLEEPSGKWIGEGYGPGNSPEDRQS